MYDRTDHVPIGQKAKATPTSSTGLAASRFAGTTEDDAAAAGETGATSTTAEGEPDHSSAALALVRKPLAICSPYLHSLQFSFILFFTSLGCAIRQAGGSVLTDVTVKLARMRHTVNSLETLDSDMREQNLNLLRSMEEATAAKINSNVSQTA